MYTLLPEEFKKRVVKVYRIRAGLVFVVFALITVLVGLVSLLPAYLNSYAQLTEVKSEGLKAQKSNSSEELKKFEKKISNATTMVETMQKEIPPFAISDVLHKLILSRVDGITLTSFEISGAGDKGGIYIQTQGKAATREALVGFKKKLSSVSGITKVELPISDLTKSKDIAFNLRINADASFAKIPQ